MPVAVAPAAAPAVAPAAPAVLPAAADLLPAAPVAAEPRALPGKYSFLYVKFLN